MLARDNQPESDELARDGAAERAAILRSAILDVLPAHIALLDRAGTIITVNESWRRFANTNGWVGVNADVGQNYLEVCRRAQGESAREASDVAAGLAAVLAGERTSFTIEYPCHGPNEIRWFQMSANPADGLAEGDTVVMHVDITRRRQMEKELEEAGRLLPIACRMARIGGWSVDLASGIVEWSDEVCAIHAMPPGTSLSVEEGIQFYAPEWRDRIREVFGACARNGTPFDEELEITTATGPRKWVRAIGEPVRDESGAIIGVHGAFQDLTSAKDAQAALALSQQRFHQLAETLPQIVWTAEPDGTVDYVSGDFYRLTGLGRVDLASRQWLEALHPADRNRCLRTLEEAITSGDEFQAEIRIFSAVEEGYRWHLTSARPVRNDVGAIVKWFGSAIDIHDRWLAEEALAEAQRRTQQVLAASGEGIHGLDAAGRIAFENPAALAMLGYELEEMVGQPGHDLLHHHHADGRPYPAEECPAHQTLRDGRTRHVEGEVFFRKDGSSFPVEYTCAPMTDEVTGTISGVVINFRDVTEKVRADGLRRMEAQVLDMISAGRPLDEILSEITCAIDRLLPGATSSVLLMDEDGRLRQGAASGLPESYTAALDGIVAGPAAGSCGTAAYRGEPVIVADIESDPLWADYRELARAHGLAACWSTPLQGADGSVLATFAVYYPTPHTPTADEFDVIDWAAQFVLVAVERTREREALRASEERFRILAQATSDIVWDWDVVADRIWWSERLQTQFGLVPGGRTTDFAFWSERVHPDDLPRARTAAKTVIDDPARSTWEEHYRLRRADGSWAQVIDRGHVIRGAQGQAVRIVGNIADVTTQRRLEEELRQSQRLDAIGKLTGGVAHDFNNLLTVILGSAELLAEELTKDPKLRTLAEMIHSASERGAELTGRLLAFARHQPLDPKPVELNRLLSDMDSLLRRTLGEQVELEVTRSDGLWQAMVDETQLESAILNLCINARDAMPGGGRLTVETANADLDEHEAAQHAEAKAGQYVLVAVSDTGEGMEAEVVARAFEPFFTTKGVGKGSGLGLSQVYGFATQSQGHARIDSEPGRGTTVKLYLPRARTEAGVERETVKTKTSEDGTGRILLVEDEDLVREHVLAQLIELGYTVTTARNGPEALTKLQKGERFDLLFTDVVMPGGMSGFELAAEARRLSPDLPVLFTTGYAEEAILRDGRLEPSMHLLQKPYRRQEIAAKVRAVLDRRSAG